MRKFSIIKILSVLALMAFSFYSFKPAEAASKYKCMVQMTNYTGEGAYVVISLINPKGEYEKTLYMQGDDDEWYNDLTSWFDFYGKKRNNIDAITGATVAGGQRSINVIEIDDSKIDTGYRIRFESAVEDQEYYEKDVEFELTSASVKSKVEGKGFIRYIRMIPN
ncbi:DUF2271 domain-containing protein [Formosa algae]|uniref:Flagellin biosynthesis protein FlgD n=1 Tax=Formosa algae TaxID=225843 RepID=A0A9X0YHQ5_9FLAO|nr:DUF2271 domain-containing protein [Formosa algae]MBP1838465.1 hypothetical protein [Formosa algae]MDQ0334600.1 hypothetical protein [Formosa algae]OEI79135.1 flagellin biosynthesis protein FlgD [Formosa algae]PNW30178.1 flagellin biosynthesis protein FlgD [Formosa algae]